MAVCLWKVMILLENGWLYHLPDLRIFAPRISSSADPGAEKQDRKTARGRWETKSQPKMRGKKYQHKNVDMKTRCFFQSTQRYSGEKLACRLSREIEVMCFLGFEKGLPYGFSQRKPRCSQLFGQRKRETEMISTRTAHLLQVNHPLSYWSNKPLAVPKEAEIFTHPSTTPFPKTPNLNGTANSTFHPKKSCACQQWKKGGPPNHFQSIKGCKLVNPISLLTCAATASINSNYFWSKLRKVINSSTWICDFFDAWKKWTKNVRTQMVVKNGDLPW